MKGVKEIQDILTVFINPDYASDASHEYFGSSDYEGAIKIGIKYAIHAISKGATNNQYNTALIAALSELTGGQTWEAVINELDEKRKEHALGYMKAHEVGDKFKMNEHTLLRIAYNNALLIIEKYKSKL